MTDIPADDSAPPDAARPARAPATPAGRTWRLRRRPPAPARPGPAAVGLVRPPPVGRAAPSCVGLVIAAPLRGVIRAPGAPMEEGS
jgi:hypothetical protein